MVLDEDCHETSESVKIDIPLLIGAFRRDLIDHLDAFVVALQGINDQIEEGIDFARGEGLGD